MKFLERIGLSKKSEKVEEATGPEVVITEQEKIELVRDLSKILESLRPDIESGAIGSVVGIDRSGRPVALALKHAISERYKTLGHKPIETRFFNGLRLGIKPGHDIRKINRVDKNLLEALETHPLDKTRKVIIADDFIGWMETMPSFIRVFTNAGYQVEVAALGSRPSHLRGQKDATFKFRDSYMVAVGEPGRQHTEHKLETYEAPLHQGDSLDGFKKGGKLSGVQTDWSGGAHALKQPTTPGLGATIRQGRQDIIEIAEAALAAYQQSKDDTRSS
ncbi:MAG TPA: hypothetical protein PK109_00330 [Candidatus Paceibacterota bacterium]|nr:hypothetical protein [Candidatus Paceibacterota bacterium]